MDDRDEYPSNSYRSREQQKDNSKPVAHGRYVKRKKTLKERLTELIYEPEGYDGYDYVYEDFVRPAILDMLGDISHNIIGSIREAIDTTLYGSVRGARRRRDGYYRTSYDDYDDYWNRERRSRRRGRRDPEDEDRRISRRRSDDAVAEVESKEEAINLIRGMQRRVHEEGSASVLNFYDDADMPTLSTDNDYGWNARNPFEARITRTRNGGYIVEPCPPIWIDKR